MSPKCNREVVDDECDGCGLPPNECDCTDKACPKCASFPGECHGCSEDVGCLCVPHVCPSSIPLNHELRERRTKLGRA
jgi:hypothetical protein